MFKINKGSNVLGALGMYKRRTYSLNPDPLVATEINSCYMNLEPSTINFKFAKWYWTFHDPVDQYKTLQLWFKSFINTDSRHLLQLKMVNKISNKQKNMAWTQTKDAERAVTKIQIANGWINIQWWMFWQSKIIKKRSWVAFIPIK